jgi:Family of unknown function (DUF6084)
MVELDFTILDVEFEPHAMSPQLVFKLRVANRTSDVAILNVMLNCQLRIEPARRAYGEAEHDRLSDLFGTPERWGQTMQTFLWTHASVAVPAFDTECVVGFRAPCSFDFNVAATKYFEGLGDGEVPLTSCSAALSSTATRTIECRSARSTGRSNAGFACPSRSGAK